MAEPMYPIIQQPPALSSTPALPFFLSKNALEASRTEILVLASGILFLASQVCLLVWILRHGGSAPPKKDQRKVAIVLPDETRPLSPDTAEALDDFARVAIASGSDGKDDSTLRLRHSSSWGGRSAPLGSQDPQERRRSAGWLGKVQDSDDDSDDEEEGKAGPQNSLSSHPDPDPEPATPSMLPLSSTSSDEGNGISGGIAEDTELSQFDAQPAWGGGPDLLDAVTKSIEKPPSPRSPRVLAADQAAIIDALCSEGDPPSPVVGAELDAPALTFGFEDPLGANRLVDLPEKDKQDHEAVELEWRNRERRDM